MPHLSPMNWLMALMTFWAILMLITSKSWWFQISSMMFNIPKTKNTNKSIMQWKWNW